MQETWIPSLGQEDSLEKEIVTHSSILAWEHPMDRGAWRAIVHGVAKELDMTQQLSNNFSITEVIFIECKLCAKYCIKWFYVSSSNAYNTCISKKPKAYFFFQYQNHMLWNGSLSIQPERTVEMGTLIYLSEYMSMSFFLKVLTYVSIMKPWRTLQLGK